MSSVSFFKTLVFSTVITLGATLVVSAQDTQTDNHQITVSIPNVALLDLESSVAKNFTASFVQPTPLEAGQKISAPQDNADLWLNYSSILPATGVVSRTVNVKVSELIPGVDVKVLARASSTGFGTLGQPTATVTLSTQDQPIITGIGSAYTVSGPNNGHNLVYSFVAEDANYSNLRARNSTVTVTYTLTDN